MEKMNRLSINEIAARDSRRGESQSHTCDLIFCNECKVNTTDERGRTALHKAVCCGYFSMVRVLIRRGANVNSRDTNMRTPLHDAVTIEKAPEIVDLLLSNGADVNAKDQVDDTPLHLAVFQNNVAIVRSLLQHGASVNLKNKYKQTPLHRVRWAKDGAAQIVELLLTNGAEATAEDYTCNKPLDSAVLQNNLAIARLLLDHGASVGRSNVLQTPLHLAVMSKAIEMIELLLTRGADVNAENCNSETPLHLAVSVNDASIVELLIEHGATVNCKDKYRQAPLHRALTMDAGVEIFELLLRNGADVNAEDCMGETPLHLAVFESNASIARLLVEYGADVNAKNGNSETPLHLAVFMNNASIVKSLIEHGASVNRKDGNRQTPLHRAVAVDAAVEIFELLLKSGAEVNAKDHEGNRPLQLMCQRWPPDDNDNTLQMLLESGAYVNARNTRGESALFHALSLDESPEKRVLVEQLLKHGADPQDPKVRQWILNRHLYWYGLSLVPYFVQLKAANLLLDEEYIALLGRHHEYHNECLQEVKELKSTIIGNGKSLYDFLHTHPTRRGAYVNSEKLQNLIQSSRLEQLFPEYSIVILAKYREATSRKLLLAPAEEAFYELIQARLPDAVDRILFYLADADLINIIEATDYDVPGERND